MALDKDRVTREALDLLNEVGLIGLTLRRLADRLGVKAPALYWHFENKQALLDAMATTMMRDMISRHATTTTWSSALMTLATDLRASLRRYRDGAKVFSGTYLTDDTLLREMEPLLRILVDAGFPLRDAVLGYSTVYSYTIGFVIEEQAVHPDRDEMDERYDPAVRARRIDSDRYPLTVAAGKVMFGDGSDERFAHGLQLIIAGMERNLSSQP